MNWPIESASFLIFLSEQPPKKVSHAPSFHTKRRDFPISYLPATSIHPSIHLGSRLRLHPWPLPGRPGWHRSREVRTTTAPTTVVEGRSWPFPPRAQDLGIGDLKNSPEKKTSPKPNKKSKEDWICCQILMVTPPLCVEDIHFLVLALHCTSTSTETRLDQDMTF